jgi:acetyl esterase/lipase
MTGISAAIRCLFTVVVAGCLTIGAARAQTYGPYPQEKIYAKCVPAGASVVRVVLLLHGGAWYGDNGKGISGQDQYLCQQVARNGTLVVPIDFRGSGIAPWPSLVLDAQMAIRWARQTYPTLPVSVLGTSSGAQVALMVGVSPHIYAPAIDPDNEAAIFSGVSSAPDCVVAFSGETDLPQLYQQSSALQKMIGNLTRNDPILMMSASAVAQIGLSGMPPTMILYGRGDPMVPLSQGEEFFAALSAARDSGQNEDEFIITPGKHVLVGLTSAEDAYYAREIAMFIERSTR